MKKILVKLAFFAIIATLIFALIACGIGDDSQLTEGLEYTLNYDGESYSVTKLRKVGNEPKIVIAAKYEGKPVTAIGDSVFHSCSGLTSIEIPNSVTSIGDFAFYECRGLTSIEIPDGVTSIGERAFYGCSGLTSIEIPNSLTYIGYNPFWGCRGLTRIDFGGTVKEWQAIEKENYWKGDNAGSYTVYCKDGTVAKDGTVSYFNA